MRKGQRLSGPEPEQSSGRQAADRFLDDLKRSGQKAGRRRPRSFFASALLWYLGTMFWGALILLGLAFLIPRILE